MDYLKKMTPIVTYAVVLFLGLSNFDEILEISGKLLTVLSPVIIGICIAFVLNLVLSFFENRLLVKLCDKSKVLQRGKRGISVFLTYMSVLIFMIVIITFIVPQVVDSAKLLIDALPYYADKLMEFSNQIYDSFGLSEVLWEDLFGGFNEVMLKLSAFTANTVVAIFNVTISITSGAVNLMIGVIFSIYILLSKEKLLRILSRINRAFIKKPYAIHLSEVAKESSMVFSKFIGGQVTEALILGSLCFLGMLLLQLPYAPLVSVLIAITSLIPIVGAFIGTVPSAFIIAMENPIQAVLFIAFILILQQLEGNLIYPKVVGNAIGISGFWVFLAITVGGGLFGVKGMLLGVPLMAVLYSVMRRIVNDKLDKIE